MRKALAFALAPLTAISLALWSGQALATDIEHHTHSSKPPGPHRPVHGLPHQKPTASSPSSNSAWSY